MKYLTRDLLSPTDRRVARQTFWLGTSSVIVLVGGIVQVAIVARMLGVQGYGTLATIAAFCALVHGLMAIPGGDMLTTFVTRAVGGERHEEAARIVRFSVALSFGMSVVGYAVIATLTLVAVELLGMGNDETYRNAALLYGAVGVLTAPALNSQAILRLADRVSLASAVALVSTTARVGLITAAWYADGGLLSVISVQVATAALSAAGLMLAAAISAERAGVYGLFQSAAMTVPPNVLRFQLGSFAASAIGTLRTNLDTILVAHLAGAADAGLYRATRHVVDYAKMPFKQLSIAARAEFSRLWYANDMAGLRAMAFKFSLVCATFALAAFGLLALLREHVTTVLLGDEFAVAAALLPIMVVGAGVASSASPLAVIPSAAGKIRPTVVSVALSLVASTTVIALLVPVRGADGAAWANATASLVGVAALAPFVVAVLRVRRSARLDSPTHE